MTFYNRLKTRGDFMSSNRVKYMIEEKICGCGQNHR